MSVREYIGARYVPVFSDPIQWDNTLSYEPLTVVTNNGTSYVSRQSVPPGTAIDNESYWVRWADYNAQLEEYIRQVQTYNASITALNEALPIANFSGTNTIDSRFDTIEANSWVTTDRINNGAVTSAKIADGTIATADIADSAVTSAKIADGTIAASDLSAATIHQFEKNVLDITNPNIKIATIGDSFNGGSNGALAGWGYQLSQIVDCQVYNYAQGTAGFYLKYNNRNFKDILQEIYNQHPDIDFLIIGGGCNDSLEASHRTATNWSQYGEDFMAEVKRLFPHVRCYIFVGLWGNSRFGQNVYQDFIVPFGNSLKRNGATGVYENCWTWFIDPANSSYVSSDNLHPTTLGYQQIAGNMISEINGIDTTINSAIYAFKQSPSVNTGVGYVFRNGTNIAVSYGHTWGDDNKQYGTLGYIPKNYLGMTDGANRYMLTAGDTISNMRLMEIVRDNFDGMKITGIGFATNASNAAAAIYGGTANYVMWNFN